MTTTGRSVGAMPLLLTAIGVAVLIAVFVDGRNEPVAGGVTVVDAGEPAKLEKSEQSGPLLSASLTEVRNAAIKISQSNLGSSETVALTDIAFPGTAKHLTPDERKFVGRLGALLNGYPGVDVGFSIGSDARLAPARASTLFLELSQQHVDERRIRLDGVSSDGDVYITLRRMR